MKHRQKSFNSWHHESLPRNIEKWRLAHGRKGHLSQLALFAKIDDYRDLS